MTHESSKTGTAAAVSESQIQPVSSQEARLVTGGNPALVRIGQAIATFLLADGATRVLDSVHDAIKDKGKSKTWNKVAWSAAQGAV